MVGLKGAAGPRCPPPPHPDPASLVSTKACGHHTAQAAGRGAVSLGALSAVSAQATSLTGSNGSRLRPAQEPQAVLRAVLTATDWARPQAGDRAGPQLAGLCKGAPTSTHPWGGQTPEEVSLDASERQIDRGPVEDCAGPAQDAPQALTRAGAAAGSGVVDSQKSKSSP